MNRFRKLMYGRYGFDQFTRFILWTAIIITIIGTILHNGILFYLSYLILFYAIFRTFSRNINHRTQENLRYVNAINAIKNRFRKAKLTLWGSKTHRYYLCPKCKQTIRVPKGKGKICITCPKCRNEFIKRT
jgi:hypothetical protein